MRSRIYLAQGPAGKFMTITAKYEDGVFKPLEDVSISEGTIVEVRVVHPKAWTFLNKGQ